METDLATTIDLIANLLTILAVTLDLARQLRKPREREGRADEPS